MKPQDIFFVLIFIFILFKRDSRLFILAGLASLIISIPLFAFWIFFTAERLIWYGAGFFLLAILLQLYRLREEK